MKHVKKSLLILTCLIFILSLNGCKKNKQQTTNTRKAEVLTPKAPGDEVLDYGEGSCRYIECLTRICCGQI